MNTAMYYIAILAPESINEQVLEWKHLMRDRFGCIVALKSPAHITLISPFWMSSELEEQLIESIMEFCSAQHCFHISLNNFDSFKPRVIFVNVLASAALTMLCSDFENHLLLNTAFPVKKSNRPFHPHITIANRDLHKKDFFVAWEYFRNKKYEESFPVNSISLMKHNGHHWDAIHTAPFPLM